MKDDYNDEKMGSSDVETEDSEIPEFVLAPYGCKLGIPPKILDINSSGVTTVFLGNVDGFQCCD